MRGYEQIQGWIIDALFALGGHGSIVQIGKWIWENHESDLRAMGDMFYVWQYVLRWEGQKLQKKGLIVKGDVRRGTWRLT